MQTPYEKAFFGYAMELFAIAGKDYELSSVYQENVCRTYRKEEQLLALVPQAQRETASQYLEDLEFAAYDELNFYFIHALHDGARLMQQLLLG